jgi:hypothetical protein
VAEVGINRIIFEGTNYEGISDKAILLKLKNQVRNHVKKLPKEFIFQSSDHNNLNKKEDIEDSYILQLCDSLVGATRFLVIGGNNNSRSVVSIPVREILKYSDEPHVRMKQSRYYRGFSLVQAERKKEEWIFSDLCLAEKKINFRQKKII